jgi:hypothetical protein
MSPEEELIRLGMRVLPPPQINTDERAPPPNGEDDYGFDARTTALDEDDNDREERDLLRRIVEAPALVYDPEPQRKWIVEDVIPDETLTLLSGEGGIGKTTLAPSTRRSHADRRRLARHEGDARVGAVRHVGGRPQGRKPEPARDPQGGT